VKQKQIKKLLPWVYQRTALPGNPLTALLEVMEGLHAPVEATLGQLDSIFDPRRTLDSFVPYLAGWVDLGGLLDVSRGGGISTSMTFPTGLGSHVVGMARHKEGPRTVSSDSHGLRRFHDP